MAPEMINQKVYDHSIDTWALGILLYELVHGYAPFPGSRDQISKGHQRMKIVFKQGLTAEYEDLVRRLLQHSADQRMSLVEVFGHAWVYKYQQKYFPDFNADADASSSYVSDEEEEEEEYEEEEYDEEEEPDTQRKKMLTKGTNNEYEYYEETVPDKEEDIQYDEPSASENIMMAEDESMTPSGTPIGDQTSDNTSMSYNQKFDKFDKFKNDPYYA